MLLVAETFSVCDELEYDGGHDSSVDGRTLRAFEMPSLSIPREIKPNQKAYAFERALGVMPAEACRRAGGKVENGHATKWERSPRVRAWIDYFRAVGHSEEMLRAQIVQRQAEIA